MDKRGSGILRMKQAMKKWGLPEPGYNEDMGYFVIKFIGPYQGTTIKISEEINERQKKALEYLKINKRIMRSEYVKLNKCSEITAKRDLNKLVEKKILKRVGITGKYTHYVLISNGSSNGS